MKNIDKNLLFESAFEHASIGMALVSPTGSWLKVNKSLCDILGYTEEELSTKTFQDLTHPDDLEIDLLNVQQLIDKKSDAYEIEKRYYHKNGNIIWVILSVSVVRNGEGDFQFFISQIQDITKRKKYFKELLEEKRRVENILEGTHAGTWEWNVKTGETRFNEYWANILGYTKEELEPSSVDTWARLTHPDDQELSNQKLEEYFEGKTNVYHAECRMKHKDGHWVWIMDRGKIITRDKNGNPEWVYGTHINITELKETQLALQKAKDRFKGIFNSTYHFIGLLDTNGIMLEVNQPALAFGGVSQAEVVGRAVWDTYWWQISKETNDNLRRAVGHAANGQNVSYEVTVWDKDKNEVTVLFNLTPYFTEGEQVSYLVAEAIQIQELVEARTQLIDKNKDLENFAHITAHDLKEPANAITSLSRLIKSKDSENLSEKSLRFLELIEESSKRMSTLIGEILIYSKIGMSTDKWEQVDLNILLNDTVEYLKTMIQDENARIEISNLPVITGNETGLRILFQNLIMNSLKYRKPEIDPEITINAEIQSDYVIITINDNGIGIEEENLERIFNKFVKINKDKKYKSSGLGLATCKKIVANHAGKIWVESELGVGTSMFVGLHK
ncbi:PAS domain S-box-containing protein [Marivirga sericea]|uniref:histidine kinase n=1 Tax=Marivirga sericea TaxID=1028 RepID=A0A1X7IYU5_9BACT|nr:PAS domain S-box protein [Marivirga sericea]SMG20071.1 PAS domain S-box-containing protein [Marivirga sericea]